MNLKGSIDSRPMTRFQWAIIALTTLVMVTEGYDIQGMAFTANAVMIDLQIESTQLGLLLSAGFIGMGLGTASAGPFADRYGRRPVLLTGLVLVAIGVFLTPTGTSFATIFAWRILTGIGIGAALTSVVVLVSEYSNAKHRALSLSIFSAGFATGGVLGGLLAPHIIRTWGWGGVFTVGGFLTITVAIIAFAALPESIIYLSANKRGHRSEKKLQRIRSIARKLKLDNMPPNDAFMTDIAGMTQQTKVGSYSELFTAGYRTRTLRLWLLALVMMGTFYFVTTWTPQLLTRVGMTQDQGITVGMFLLAGGVIGTLSFGLLSTKWDVRRVVAFFMIGSAILAITFTMSTQFLFAAIAVGVLLGVMVGAMTPSFFSFSTMSYPEVIRATGAGAASTVGRLATIVVPILVGVLLDVGVGPNALYFAASIGLLLGAIVAWSQPLEQGHAGSVAGISSDEVPVQA